MYALIRKRIPHIIKKIMKTTCPSNLLFFDCETKGRYFKDQPGCTFQYLWFGYAYACRYEEGRETRVQKLFFKNTNSFWKFVLSRMDKCRPLYVFAHNLPFDLTVCDFWEHKVFKNTKVNFTIFEAPPTVISLLQNGNTINFVDTLNYWRTSLREIGEGCGMDKLEMPSIKQSFIKWKIYCERDVMILKTAVLKMMSFIKEHNLGPFSFTQASQAMAAFRTRFMKHQIFVHDNVKALSLERKAYHGGLVHNFFIGKVEKKIWKLDVNSLYPSVMLSYFPVKLVAYEEGVNLRNLRKYAKSYGLVANVDIKTDEDLYPVKDNGKLMEARGNFNTTICGSELLRALRTNSITYCYAMGRYELQRIFKEFVEFFYAKRLEYKKPPINISYDLFCKLMMNSLYGKFGQRSYEWVDLTWDNFQLWYALKGLPFPKSYTLKNYLPKGLFLSSSFFPLGSPDTIQVRKIGTVEQMRLPVDEHSMSCPIIAAYVTSYGRERLRELIRKAGKKHVYYCDTDSLFVDKQGYHNLLKWKEIDPTTLGKLKIEETSSKTIFKCPKVYTFNGQETIKGIRKDAIQIGENEYMQNQFEGLRTILQREPNPYIKISWITKKNSYIVDKVNLTRSGWTEPIRLSMPKVD